MHGSDQRMLKQINLVRTLLELREVESPWWVQLSTRYVLLEMTCVRRRVAGHTSHKAG